MASTTQNQRFLKISHSLQEAANERLLANYDEIDRQQIEKMTAIFTSIDVNGTGSITQEAFRKYVQKNPKGWPLVDLFRAKTMNQNERDLLVNFWFRKLDTDGDGSVTYAEFINMFFALRDTKVQQSMYTDFLINLFDDNMDGRIDKREFTKMMSVLFGEEPPQAVLDQMPEEGFDRDSLTRVMHSVSMDYQLLPASAVGAFPSATSGGAGAYSSGMYNIGVTESRVWNMESGMFETVANSALASPTVGSPNSGHVNVFGNPSTEPSLKDTEQIVTHTSNEVRAATTKCTPKEAAKLRNKERKAQADRASLLYVVVATAAITTGLCVFAGVYGRKLGKF